METEAVFRGKEWIFDALWGSCIDPTAPKCWINIPLTFIFKDSLPYKAIISETETGVIKRLELDEIGANLKIGENAFQDDQDNKVNKYLRITRKLLIEYSVTNEYSQAQLNSGVSEPYIALAFYIDGEKEDLTLRAFDILIRKSQWRAQVNMIQSYIPATDIKAGYFTTIGIKKIRSLLEEQGAEAADTLTRSLSKYVENAFLICNGKMSTSKSYKQTGMRLLVKEMKARFALDHKDKIIFLYSELVNVDLIPNMSNEEKNRLLNRIETKEDKISIAAKDMVFKLKMLLLDARRQGLSIEESFLHFDPQRSGFIDVDMFIDGLARLGMGATFPVAECMVELIGGPGSGLLTLDDFQKLLYGQEDVQLFQDSSKFTYNNETASVDTKSNVNLLNLKKKKNKIMKSLRPPTKPLLDPLPVPFGEIGVDLDTHSAITLEGFGTDSFMNSNASMESMQLPLALPSSMYTTFASYPEPIASELPSWTREGNKKALEELKMSHIRWLKKKKESGDQRNISTTTTALSCVATDTSVRVNTPSKSRQGSPSNGKRVRTPGSPSAKVRLDLNENKNTTNKLPGDKLDEYFTTDDGVVVTYRTMHGAGPTVLACNNKTKEKLDVFRYKSILEVRVKKLEEFRAEREARLGEHMNIREREIESVLWNKFKNEMDRKDYSRIRDDVSTSSKGNAIDRWMAYTLVVIPDMFMTLDSVHKYVEPLMNRYPLAHIVLIGITGLPNTSWPVSCSLTPDHHAIMIAKLLHYLKINHKLSPYRGEPIFLLGIGTGVLCMSHFINYYLPSMPWLQNVVRAVMVVNGVFKISKNIKRIYRVLQQTMVQSIAHEANELIASLHFWSGYFEKNGRNKCIEEFWGNRKGLNYSIDVNGQMSDSSSIGNNSSVTAANRANYKGVLDQLAAFLSPILEDFDARAILKSTNVPIVIVQSTEDQFYGSQVVTSTFKQDKLPENRYLVNDIVECNELGAIYVHYLEAGHEVIQERPLFLLGLVSNLAQLHGIRPNFNDESVEEEKIEEFDMLALAAKRRKQQEDEAKAKADALEALENERKAKRKQEKEEQRSLRQQLKSMKDSGKDEGLLDEVKRIEVEQALQEEKRSREEEERKQLELAEEASKEAVLKKEKAARQQVEREKRAKLIEERRRREIRAQRMKQLEVLYEMVRLYDERAAERKELKKMLKEDKRSKHMNDYAQELMMISTFKPKAVTRQKELYERRREEAVKKVEDDMARKRSAEILRRKKKAQDALGQLESIGFFLEGSSEKTGYELDTTDVNIPRAYTECCGRIMKDLLYLRQQTIECLKRQSLIEEKMEVFLRQQDSVATDLGVIRRKIRLLIKDEAPKSEIERARRQLVAKEETYQELSALTEARQGQVSAANKSVIALKLLSRATDDTMQQRLRDMLANDGKFNEDIKNEKALKDNLVIDKDKCRFEIKILETKIKKLEKEQERIKSVKSDFVDSDMWNEGIVQRMDKKTLKKYLKSEIKRHEAKAAEEIHMLNEISARIQVCNDRIDNYTRASDKMTMAYKTFRKAYDKFRAVSVKQLIQGLADRANQALSDHERSKEAMARENNEVYVPLAVRLVREKDPDLRSRDERKFIGIDLIMNPSVYENVSIIEAEQMQFDDDYQWHLDKANFERLQKLSADINLALPFLHNREEIDAHRLLNLYYRGIDDHVLLEKDHNNAVTSYNLDGASNAIQAYANRFLNAKIVTKEQIKEAERIERTLVREALRDSVRCKLESEEMNDEERDWLQLDKILSPHIYDKSEHERVTEMKLSKRLKFTALRQEPLRRVTESARDEAHIAHEKAAYYERDTQKEGNQYNDLRWRYENDEVVFDHSWICPFNRSQLLVIRDTDPDNIESEDGMRAKRLIDKYYVAEDESLLGRERVKVLFEVSKQIQDLIDGTFEREQKKKLETLSKLNILVNKGRTGVTQAPTSEQSVIPVDIPNVERTSSVDRNLFMNPMVNFDSLDEEDQKQLDDTRQVVRVWGSWSKVHPASAGESSQEVVFLRSLHDSATFHPAAYAVHENVVIDHLDEAISSMSHGMKATAADNHDDSHPNDPNSEWFLVDSIKDLSMIDPKKCKGKTVILPNPDPIVIYQVTNATLNTRQSRSHRFHTVDNEEAHIMDMTVVITYQGTVGKKFGRLAAAMYLVPENEDTEDGVDAPMPIPVGHSPYTMQTLNYIDHGHHVPGRIVILHKPYSRPIRSCKFQIVIGCASPTEYSIEVTSKTSRIAEPVVDEQLAIALKMQERFPTCLSEMESLNDSWRMIERKLLVCERMVEESRLESLKCQKFMSIIAEKLDIDETELNLYEDERKDLIREMGIYEIEYGQAVANFTCRCREMDDLKEGIKMIFEFQRQRQVEKRKIKKDLEEYRKILPACYAALKSYPDASRVATLLNTVVTAGDSSVEIGVPKLLTPAQNIRRRFKLQGFDSLELTEQQWCVLDQAMHPQEYEWLHAQEEEENEHRMKQGLLPIVKRYAPAVEMCRIKKYEIDHILTAPSNLLTLREIKIRKVARLYHDNAELMQKRLTEMAMGYSQGMAESVRIKHPSTWTREESDWASIDKILHKEIWDYYVRKPVELTGSSRPKKFEKVKHFNEVVVELESTKTMFGGAKRMFSSLFGGGKKNSTASAQPQSSTQSPEKTASGNVQKRKKHLPKVSAEKMNTPNASATGKGSASVSGNTASAANTRVGDSKSDDDSNGPRLKEDKSQPASIESEKKSKWAKVAVKKVLDADAKEKADMSGDEPANNSNTQVTPTRNIKTWKCTLGKEDIVRCWRGPTEVLLNDEEIRVHKLLVKFSGTYLSYTERNGDALKRKKHAVKLGSHIKYEHGGKVISTDIDIRARQLLDEIDRVRNCKDEHMNSDILHGTLQRYPTKLLRMHLEEALDSIIIDQIKDRERAERAKRSKIEVEDDERYEAQIESIAKAENKDVSFIVDKKAERRAFRRHERNLKLKGESVEEQLLKAKKMINLTNKSGVELELAIIKQKLGVGGCMACRTNPCSWKPPYDHAACKERKESVDKEMTRVKLARDQHIFESMIAWSAFNGGNTTFTRHDLLHELQLESVELHRKMHLIEVDKEFHDAVQSNDEYCELRSLHGFPVMLWGDNARLALGIEHNRLIAIEVARDTVDVMLDWMQEGWYFGEIDTKLLHKRDDHIDGHNEKLLSKEEYIMKSESESVALKATEMDGDDVLLEGRKGDKGPGKLVTNNNKFKKKVTVTDSVVAKVKETRLKVARNNNRHERILNETEGNIRFGLFCLTIMYFRAIFYLRKKFNVLQPVSDQGTAGPLITDETVQKLALEKKNAVRKKKIDLILSRQNVGDARRVDREREEHRDAITTLQAIVRRQAEEVKAGLIIQKLYRGHLGRKAAKRWALKHNEFRAMYYLLSSAAVCVQRQFRGWLARQFTIKKRIDMGQIISLMRAQEATADEDVYWETHPWQRFKKENKEWLDKKLRSNHKTFVVGGAMESEETQAASLEQRLEEMNDNPDVVLPDEVESVEMDNNSFEAPSGNDSVAATNET